MRLVDRSLSSFRWSAGWLVMFVLGAAASTLPGQERADDGGEKPAEVSLFDGQSLGDWKPTKFGGEGEVEGNIGHRIGSHSAGLSEL